MDQNRRVKRTVRVTCTHSVKEVRFVNPVGSPGSFPAGGVISEAYSTTTEIVVHESIQDDPPNAVYHPSHAPLLLPRLLPVEAAEDSYPPQSSALYSAEPRFSREPHSRYEAPYSTTESVEEHEGSRIRRLGTPYCLDGLRHSPRTGSLPHPQLSEPSDRSQYYSPTPRTPFSPSPPVSEYYLDPQMPTDNGHYHAQCASPTDRSYEPLLGSGHGMGGDASESHGWVKHHSVPQRYFSDHHREHDTSAPADRVPSVRHRDADYSRSGSPSIFCHSTGELVPSYVPPPSGEMVHARYSDTRLASHGGRQYDEGRYCTPVREGYEGALDYCEDAMAQSPRYPSGYPVDAARYRTH